jgi:hypothetical protein
MAYFDITSTAVTIKTSVIREWCIENIGPITHDGHLIGGGNGWWIEYSFSPPDKHGYVKTIRHLFILNDIDAVSFRLAYPNVPIIKE